jgi:tetratricopeptide (TPR) repeat protein
MLREWRRARGWDVPQLARQLRHASQEPVAAHDGLVRMIRSWERGAHALSERYELLYRALGFGDGPAERDRAAGSGPDKSADRGSGRDRAQGSRKHRDWGSRLPSSREVPSAAATREQPREPVDLPYATLGAGRPSSPEADIVEVCCRTPDGRITFVAVPLRQLTGDPVALPPRASEPAPAEPDSGDRTITAAPRIVRDQSAEHFLIARRTLRDNDNLFGPRDVIPLALRQLAAMRELSHSLGEGGRRDLLLPQIQFADLLGWLYQDSCDYEAAQRWLDRALQWAHSLSDDCCVAFVLARKSQLAGDTRDASTAIATAGAAMRLAGRDNLVSAAAATYGAHGHALAGDADTAKRLYDKARAAIRQARTLTGPGTGHGCVPGAGTGSASWMTFMDDAYIDVYHAHSLAVLGHHAAAADGFGTAIPGLRPGFHRDRGVYLAREARSRAATGEHDRAAELAEQALMIGTETQSARIFAELDGVRDATRAADRHPAVSRLRAALAAPRGLQG